MATSVNAYWYRSVLFTVIVLHWATNVDRQESSTASSAGRIEHGISSKSSASKGKKNEYMELDLRLPQLTTKIEANGDTLQGDELAAHGIEVKTQHIQETETESFETENEAGAFWRPGRDSQERIINQEDVK